MIFIVAATGWRGHTMGLFIHGQMAKICANREVHVRVGDAAGADAHVRNWCLSNRVSYTVYRADWDNHGKQAGPIRNNAMLLGLPDGYRMADLLVGFPEPSKFPRIPGSGSWGCIGRAFELGIEVVIPPVPRFREELWNM